MLKFVADGFTGLETVRAVRVPKRRGDVGYDLCASQDYLCYQGLTRIQTGVAIEAKMPYWYLITGRSSLTNKGLFTVNGIIDCGYQGELLVSVVNCLPTPIKIEAGEYIAQCIFFQVLQPQLHEVNEFTPTERGANGFGSTDR